MQVCGGYFVSTQGEHTGAWRHIPKMHVHVHVCVGGTTWSAYTETNGCGHMPQLPSNPLLYLPASHPAPSRSQTCLGSARGMGEAEKCGG